LKLLVKSSSDFVSGMADATAIQGHKFATFDEGVSHVEQFCKAGCHPVRRDSRTTVAQYNSKIRAADARLTDLPGDAMYAQRWSCKHFGTFRVRGQQDEAKSRSRSHYSRGCKFFVYLAWSKDCRQYEVKSCNLEHNHDIGPEHFDLYASNRYVLKRYRQELIDSGTQCTDFSECFSENYCYIL